MEKKDQSTSSSSVLQGGRKRGRPLPVVVETMSGEDVSAPLPSSIDDGSVTNIHSSFVIQCLKCDKRIPHSLLEGHRNWHERVNVLAKLKAVIRSKGLPPFGPLESGRLLKLSYKKDQDDGKKRVLDIPGLSHKDLRDVIQHVSSGEAGPLLKYRDGLKYTFGNSFTGREDQGEFIYFNLSDIRLNLKKGGVFLKAENYFRLECKDQGIWISGVDEAVVSVNGLVFGGGSCGTLEFGDVVTISVGPDDKGQKRRGGERRFCDFLFTPTINQLKGEEASGLQSLESGDGNNDERRVLNNPLILQNVLYFLPTKAAKQLRLVTQLWNEEVLKVLRDRVLLTIFPRLPGNSKREFLHLSDLFIHSRLKDLYFPHWTVTLPEDVAASKGFPTGGVFYPIPNDTKRDIFNIQRKAARDGKILDDLSFFLAPEFQTAPRVTTLHLSTAIGSGISIKIFQVLIQAVKDTLTDFDLDLTIFEGFSYDGEMQELPRLESLSLLLNGKSRDDGRTFLMKFLPSVHKLHSLTFKDHYPSDSGPVDFKPLALEKLGILQVEGKKFANLSSISICEVDGVTDIVSIGSLKQDSLKELKLQLTKAATLTQLSDALGKHANSLQQLTLHFGLTGTEIDIKFPQRLPKLKCLFLCFLAAPWADPATFRFNFANQNQVAAPAAAADGEPEDNRPTVIDYGRHLPSLSKLTIWPTTYNALTQFHGPKMKCGGTSWKMFLPIMTSFMGTVTNEEGHVSSIPSVTTVKVPYLLSGKYHNVLDNLEQVFPNAHFDEDELALARGRPLWEEGVVEEVEDDDDEDSDSVEEDINDDYDYC